MSVLQVSSLLFVAFFVASLGGLYLSCRISPNHLDAISRDFYKATRNVIVGLAAITLGLHISTAKISYDRKAEELKTQASKVILLDRVLSNYGPEADGVKRALREVLTNEIEQIQLASDDNIAMVGAVRAASLETLRPQLLNLQPKDDAHAWLKNTALGLGQEITGSRWKIYEELGSNIQWQVVWVLGIWLAGIFFNLGLIAPYHWLAVGGLFATAIFVAFAIFITLELDMPYSGSITISAAPLQSAAEVLMLE
jgi:hypothetical protein